MQFECYKSVEEVTIIDLMDLGTHSRSHIRQYIKQEKERQVTEDREESRGVDCGRQHLMNEWCSRTEDTRWRAE